MLTVFTGPSLEAAAVRAALPEARVAPPACRGDVDRALADGASRILLIDGGFAHRLAVAPSEIVRALRAGASVHGAASLGALRVAECHPAGMQGLGAVARLYRLGVLRDDDEVAVATEPERGFRASSVALVNIRFAALAALREGLLNRAGAEALLTVAKRLHFSERLWDPMLAAAGLAGQAALRDLCLATDVKRRDAQRAVAWVAANPLHAPPARRPSAAPDPRPAPAPSAAPDELLGWLRASGRYRRYWARPPGDPGMVWTALAHHNELELELMRWQAVKRGVLLAGAPAGMAPLDPARGTVAAAHGFGSWRELEAAIVDGCLPGGVAVTEVKDAVRALTLARDALWAGQENVGDRQLHSGLRGFGHLHALQPAQRGTHTGAPDLG